MAGMTTSNCDGVRRHHLSRSTSTSARHLSPCSMDDAHAGADADACIVWNPHRVPTD